MKKGTIWAISIAGAGIAFYKLYWDTQKRYAQIIIRNGFYHSDISNLLSFEKGYVKMWALAAQTNKPQFEYNGVVYSTNGGLKVAPISGGINSPNTLKPTIAAATPIVIPNPFGGVIII